MNEESGIVKIEVGGETQKLELLSWPCSFTFSVLTKDHIFLEPDLEEKIACGKSILNIVVDILSGSIMEISKGTLCLADELLFSKIHPILFKAIESIQTLLEL